MGCTLVLAAATVAPVRLQAEVKPPKLKVKVAYVDTDRCIYETEEGLRAKAMLKKISERKQLSLAIVEENLKKQQEAIAKLAEEKKDSVTAAALAYQRDLLNFNQMVKQSDNEIARKENALFEPIRAKTWKAFERIGKSEGYDVVIDRKALPIGRGDLDLTERVIHELNWGVAADKSAVPAPTSAGPAASASSAPK